MVTTRVSTFGQNNYNFGFISDTQRRINDFTIQISSGKKAQNLSGVARDGHRLLNLENMLVRNQEYQRTIDTVDRRLGLMETSTSTIFDRATDFRATLLTSANDPNADVLPLQQMAEDFYEEIAALLNVNDDGRYLFSGSETDSAPVATLDELETNFRNHLTQSGATAYSTFVASGKNSPQEVAFFNTDNLAPETAVDRDTGLPIREMQIIDFMTGDKTFGSLANSLPPSGSFITNGDLDFTFNDVDASGGFTFAGDTIITSQALNGVGPITSTVSARFDTNSDTTVDFTETGPDVNPFDFSQLYYKGDKAVLNARVEDDVTVDYGVKADEDGFMRVLAAAAMLALPIAEPKDVDAATNTVSGNLIDLNAANAGAGNAGTIDLEAKINAALKLLEDALLDVKNNSLTPISEGNNLTDVRARIGLSVQELEQTDERLTNFNLFYEESIAEIENTDITEAATLLSQNQLILESSFLALSSISNLSLANFLR